MTSLLTQPSQVDVVGTSEHQPLDYAPPREPKGFDVRFGVSGTLQHAAPNSFKFYGPGQLLIGPDLVGIESQRHHMLWFDKPEQHAFHLDTVANVVVKDRHVRFAVLKH